MDSLTISRYSLFCCVQSEAIACASTPMPRDDFAVSVSIICPAFYLLLLFHLRLMLFLGAYLVSATYNSNCRPVSGTPCCSPLRFSAPIPSPAPPIAGSSLHNGCADREVDAVVSFHRALQLNQQFPSFLICLCVWHTSTLSAAPSIMTLRACFFFQRSERFELIFGVEARR